MSTSLFHIFEKSKGNKHIVDIDMVRYKTSFFVKNVDFKSNKDLLLLKTSEFKLFLTSLDMTYKSK